MGCRRPIVPNTFLWFCVTSYSMELADMVALLLQARADDRPSIFEVHEMESVQVRGLSTNSRTLVRGAVGGVGSCAIVTHVHLLARTMQRGGVACWQGGWVEWFVNPNTPPPPPPCCCGRPSAAHSSVGSQSFQPWCGQWSESRQSQGVSCVPRPVRPLQPKARGGSWGRCQASVETAPAP